MNGFLFDGNMLLDIINLDPTWYEWSAAQVVTAIAQNLAFINPIIYAEPAPAFPSPQTLDRWLNPATFQRLPLPSEAGWRAGQAFAGYRRAGGTRPPPPPGFYLGAPVAAAGLTLVTRDVARDAADFPKVALLSL